MTRLNRTSFLALSVVVLIVTVAHGPSTTLRASQQGGRGGAALAGGRGADLDDPEAEGDERDFALEESAGRCDRDTRRIEHGVGHAMNLHYAAGRGDE